MFTILANVLGRRLCLSAPTQDQAVIAARAISTAHHNVEVAVWHAADQVGNYRNGRVLLERAPKPDPRIDSPHKRVAWTGRRVPVAVAEDDAREVFESVVSEARSLSLDSDGL